MDGSGGVGVRHGCGCGGGLVSRGEVGRLCVDDGTSGCGDDRSGVACEGGGAGAGAGAGDGDGDGDGNCCDCEFGSKSD